MIVHFNFSHIGTVMLVDSSPGLRLGRNTGSGIMLSNITNAEQLLYSRTYPCRLSFRRRRNLHEITCT